LLAIIGPPTSGDTIIAQQIAAPLKIPVFAPIATNTNISRSSNEKDSRNFFRLVSTDEIQARKVSKLIKTKLDLKKYNNITRENILMIHDSKEYGKDLAEAIEKEIKIKEFNINTKSGSKELNIDIRKVEVEKTGSYQMLTSHLTREYLQTVDFVVVAGYPSEAESAIRYLHESQYRKTVLLTDGSYSNQFLKAFIDQPNIPENQEVYLSSITRNWDRNTKESKQQESLRSYYESQSFDNPKNEIVSIRLSLATYTYDALSIINFIKNSKKINFSISRMNIFEFMKNKKTPQEFKYGIFNCAYRFNENGDNELSRIYFYLLKRAKNDVSLNEVSENLSPINKTQNNCFNQS
jgi:ABC-type branched-subunit amino acid transport system substrate-binding protein